jgi:hypothetical protein
MSDLKTEIVKVQVPMTGARNHVLVYAKKRSRPQERPLVPDLISKLRGDMKGYFEATWDEGLCVAEQPW